MILESAEELDAFEFVCDLASSACDRGCNDLSPEMVKKFSGLTIPCDEDGKIVQRPIQYDFDIVAWFILRGTK